MSPAAGRVPQSQVRKAGGRLSLGGSNPGRSPCACSVVQAVTSSRTAAWWLSSSVSLPPPPPAPLPPVPCPHPCRLGAPDGWAPVLYPQCPEPFWLQGVLPRCSLWLFGPLTVTLGPELSARQDTDEQSLGPAAQCCPRLGLDPGRACAALDSCLCWAALWSRSACSCALVGFLQPPGSGGSELSCPSVA